MIAIVGLGIALVLVLFFSAIVDRSIIGAFGVVVLLGVVIGISGNALIDNCNERLATQETVKYYKTYDSSDGGFGDGDTYRLGSKTYTDGDNNVTINSYTSHGEKPNYAAEVITKRIPNKVRQENSVNGDFIHQAAARRNKTYTTINIIK